jgi:transcriptional regulator
LSKYLIEAKNNQMVAWALERSGLTAIQAYALGRRLDGLKQREIAEEMGVSQQNIAAYVRVAICKIKKHQIENYNP